MRIPEEAPLIYIVDDEPESRLLARSVLESQGFEVAEAADGSTALAEIGHLRPDLVLLDVMMPTIDGFAVCAQLRERPETSNVPVLMLTGLGDVASINQAFDLGATDFAVKPIQWALLGHRIRYLLRSARTLAELRVSEDRLVNAQRIAQLGHWSADLVAATVEGASRRTRDLWHARGGLHTDLRGLSLVPLSASWRRRRGRHRAARRGGVL